MTQTMFCPKCGGPDQTPDSYCRQCGEWLPDLRSGSRGFRRQSRESRIRRMRVLQFISIGLSIAALLVTINFLSTGRDKEMLTLAALCMFLVTIYQVITVFIGNKVLAPQAENRASAEIAGSSTPVSALKAADTNEFISPGSVVDNTTSLLEPTPVTRQRNDRR